MKKPPRHSEAPTTSLRWRQDAKVLLTSESGTLSPSALPTPTQKTPHYHGVVLGVLASWRFLFVALLGVLLSACGPLGGGAMLSGITASTAGIVPGSSGVGNPPGALVVRYTLGSAADVTARVQ